MRLAFRLLTTVLLFWLATGAARAAAPVCRHTPDIVATAEFLLVDPRSEQRFWRDHFGSDAAFLMIRHGDLSPERGRRLIDELGRRAKPPQRIEDLRLAFMDPAERLATLGAGPPNAPAPPGGLSAARAFIVDGQEDQLFRELARRAALPEVTANLVTSFQVMLARALGDLDDATRTRAAGKAEAHGLWALALDLVALNSDPGDWLGLLRRSPLNPATPDQLVQHFTPLWRGHVTLRPRPYSLDSLPPELRAAAKVLQARRSPQTGSIDAVTELARVAPRTQTLLTLLNQTGEARLGSEVAAPLLAAIRAGRIDPAEDDDKLRAMLFTGVAQVLGLATARGQLATFRGSPDGDPNETALLALERAVAREMLAGFVRGEQPAPPRHQLLSPGFDWDGWLATATAIRAGQAPAESNRAIAVELLQAAGRPAEALGVLRAMGPTDEARRHAHVMLLALDQRCAKLLSPPLPLGQVIYRFEPR
ncbi:hypothetical protein E8L99_23160 [Phreatobacter aquaticus]|uniref:Uncharacterized protein n=1 Tax=Phreatobacter aquaticus TaxID=2570229 RepID=A0A4D7QLG2_9HYPH|nr:hypothetical protein [Phreatobacter aquaticus]QCK88448.1 hypothetical protein E8L99_23160 [Phreatobacter aquaticus]